MKSRSEKDKNEEKLRKTLIRKLTRTIQVPPKGRASTTVSLKNFNNY
jgi:hypothetical protein